MDVRDFCLLTLLAFFEPDLDSHKIRGSNVQLLCSSSGSTLTGLSRRGLGAPTTETVPPTDTTTDPTITVVPNCIDGQTEKFFQNPPLDCEGVTVEPCSDKDLAAFQCSDSDYTFDAVVIVGKQAWYFKGRYYWIVNEAEDPRTVAYGYPRVIAKDWKGLPEDVDSWDTVAYFPDGRFMFFKGNRYWTFNRMMLMAGYPKDINVGFCGITGPLDAVLVTSMNETYLFKGGRHYIFRGSENMLPCGSPFPNSKYGIPTRLTAAVEYTDGTESLYNFFVGDQYYEDFDKAGTGKMSEPKKVSEDWGVSCTDLKASLAAITKDKKIQNPFCKGPDQDC